MRLLTLVPVSLFLFTGLAHAESCIDLKSCAKLMFDLEGQRYIWDAKMDEYKFVGSPDVEMTKENADVVFSALLDHLELARVPVGDGKTFRVVRSRIRRSLGMPVLDASAEREPAFPDNTWDWVQLRYKVRSPDAASYLESAYRDHVTGESRVNSDENAGLVIVTGPAPVVRKMYDTIRSADKPLSAAMKEKKRNSEKLRLQARFGALPATPLKN